MTLHPLRLKRLEKDLSQLELAIRSGVNQYAISLIERGYRKPRNWEQQALAKVLDCEVPEIFHDAESG